MNYLRGRTLLHRAVATATTAPSTALSSQGPIAALLRALAVAPPCTGLPTALNHPQAAQQQQPGKSNSIQQPLLRPACTRMHPGFGGSSLWSGNSTSSSSSSRGFATTPAPSTEEDSTAEVPRRRRRSATESRAAMRRTTESRAAIEDVAVMSRNQLLRRNKPWLAEQCWQQGLSHEGLKEDLIQRLLAWQGTEAGQAAATAALAAAAAARAAVNTAAAAAAAANQAPPAAAPQQAAGSTAQAAGSSTQAAAPLAHVDAGSGPTNAGVGVTAPADRSQLARPAAGACAAAAAVPAETDADAADSAADGICSGGASSAAATTAAAADAAQGATIGWQAPRSAAAAAAGSLTLFLGQLRDQPSNTAIVAGARNAVEQYTRQLLATSSSSSSGGGGGSSASSSGDRMQQLVSELAATVAQHSSPQSLAALAKTCYSREIQDPVLAASLAEAVAAVAAQLGPQEVYGVLRLLVEHRGSAAEDPIGFATMDKAFRVLAGGMIRCSEALKPVQLAEAVELLGVHQYDDAFGLWMISKEAAARLVEFDPVKEGGSVVLLLDAIAGMHVADDAMACDVAAAVEARKGEYSTSQLSAISSALQRMGSSVTF